MTFFLFGFLCSCRSPRYQPVAARGTLPGHYHPNRPQTSLHRLQRTRQRGPAMVGAAPWPDTGREDPPAVGPNAKGPQVVRARRPQARHTATPTTRPCAAPGLLRDDAATSHERHEPTKHEPTEHEPNDPTSTGTGRPRSTSATLNVGHNGHETRPARSAAGPPRPRRQRTARHSPHGTAPHDHGHGPNRLLHAPPRRAPPHQKPTRPEQTNAPQVSDHASRPRAASDTDRPHAPPGEPRQRATGNIAGPWRALDCLAVARPSQ